MTITYGGKRMKNNILTAIALLSCALLHAQEFEIPECVHLENSQLIVPGDRSRLDSFYERLDSLMHGNEENLNIWHVGGSHVQGSTFPNRLMEHFQDTAGRADRGILFPRQLAKTSIDSSYVMSTGGRWEAPMLTRSSKIPKPRYGITGFGARCDSAAWVGLNIDPTKMGRWHFNRVRILGYGTSGMAYPEVVIDSLTITAQFDTLSYSYVFDLPRKTDTITINFIVPEGEKFVLNGIQPMTGDKGINYFASGVNGARTTSWVDKCVDFSRDLQLVKPDLVIFGLGINDSACDPRKFSPAKFKNNYRRLIREVLEVSPDCAIIFHTNNDSYRYVKGGMTYNRNAEAVRKAMMELAQEYGAGVWDLYGVMGGANSVHTWLKEDLVKKDRLHFTTKGYQIIGDLLFEAIMKDWQNSTRQ
jgi:lysophospholipase L1-like esterase